MISELRAKKENMKKNIQAKHSLLASSLTFGSMLIMFRQKNWSVCCCLFSKKLFFSPSKLMRIDGIDKYNSTSQQQRDQEFPSWWIVREERENETELFIRSKNENINENNWWC